MTRTTLDLDPSVIRNLRERSTREGKSMGRVASELLASLLAEPEPAPEPPPIPWIARDLGTPRVDLEDREAVRRILDTD
ncbi:MAG: antitoxin [Candidatus Dormibacteria bacterium]